MSTLRKLLLVDDSLAVLNAHLAFFKAHGFLVFIATSGEEALLKAKVVAPDALLVDLQMPEVNGLQLIEAFRRNPGGQVTPIILYSAAITEEEVEHAKQLGGVEWVPKGRVTSQESLERLERCFTRKPRRTS